MKFDQPPMGFPPPPDRPMDDDMEFRRPPFGGDNPPPPPPPPTPMMLLNEITKMFFNLMRDESESVGHHNSVRWLLMHLSHMDGVTQLDLAKATHLKPPTVSVALQKMESAGLVRRETDPEDQRQTRVYLTEEGAAFDLRMRNKLKEMEHLALRDITEEEAETLMAILCKIKQNIIRIDSEQR